ncbi:S9 family serine peptidase [Liquorilactobacillus aquaticus DSM 21051]|uniref:S9 family serine peptidase n=1 Tax=Liquorilactobacillus aquaticus DSM 21051 TaxID=1423725 RepID=A0A0R2D9X2_9LACO|nr:alpha/beta fold hydrolase [Liquorilactobacillus aquaticus]KRM97513.1 S9 family serine peptidase [Liquorilactobacillus aquaticus DSM 21051]
MITITSKEIKKIPVLELVQSDKKEDVLPLVFFYHGWTGCKEKVLTQGYEIAKRGFRVVLPDALYHGDRLVSGKASEHKLEFWKIIVNSIKEFPDLLAYYRENFGIKDEKVGVSGLSMGGITTCALLRTYPQITAGVCLMGSPAPCSFARQLLHAIPGMEDIDPNYVEEQVKALEVVDLSLNPQKIASRPVHFWHGTADEMVPYQPTKAFFDQIKNHSYAENVTFTTTQGAAHKVSYETTVEMADKFADYLA